MGLPETTKNRALVREEPGKERHPSIVQNIHLESFNIFTGRIQSKTEQETYAASENFSAGTVPHMPRSFGVSLFCPSDSSIDM